MMYKIVVLVLFLHQLSCNSPVTMDQLKEKILSRLEQEKGIYAVAFTDLQTGSSLLIREHEPFHAASTMKTPVLLEVYNQASAGKFRLSDSIVLYNQFKSIVDSSLFSLDPNDDSEKDLYSKIGQKRSIRDLLHDMITMSSNLATNIIIDTVGAGNVMQTLHKLGMNEMKVLRGVEDNKAFQKGLNNMTTAYDLMLLFEKISKGEAVNPDASAEMIDILLGQHFNSIIPARLPGNVKVAHKTGNITGVEHDGGIVFLPDGRKYVLILLSKEIQDAPSATSAMAAVSEMIYQFEMKNKH